MSTMHHKALLQRTNQQALQAVPACLESHSILYTLTTTADNLAHSAAKGAEADMVGPP